MCEKIRNRLTSLRKFMETNDLHAFIVPTTDPHLSEYPAEHWSAREWISGFTGSAGVMVITRDKAGLWTDSRYFLQADSELKDTGIILFKEGLPETPSYEEWLNSELSKGQNVGIDANVYSAKDAISLAAVLSSNEINVVDNLDPFNTIWEDRPAIPTNPIFLLPTEFSGKSAADKIEEVRQILTKKGADSILVASLDTIAWMFNIRGNDVQCNPIAIAYAYISQEEAILFINPLKLSQEISKALVNEGITIAEYAKTATFTKAIKAGTRICISGNQISYSLYNSIPASCRIIDTPSPINLLKSKKNGTEVDGFRNAMLRDGAALVQFFIWLEQAVPTGNVTELDIVDKLIEYRSKQAHYVGESFPTIAGYATNGAIVHYHVDPNNPAKLKSEGLVLIDSGAQYFDGTTDITRTVALGALSEEMKSDYTMVLKGHIALATARFPQGTRGSQLDILARKTLWDNGLNYLHGTGHGIGHFLNVHEGPQSIRMDENPTALEPGMVTSNEPGMYRANKHGIRIENLILTQEDISTEFGNFYSFETLTLCPIDTTPIVKAMLTEGERDWLNSYHQMVYDRLSTLVSEDAKAWLKSKTEKI